MLFFFASGLEVLDSRIFDSFGSCLSGSKS